MSAPVVSMFESNAYEQNLKRGADLLRDGGVVVLPTETVYGAAAQTNQPKAMQRLKALRGSDPDRPFTVHLAHPQDALQFIDKASEVGQRLIRKLWPGPVGLVFHVSAERRAQVAAGAGIDESALYDGQTITLRCPDHVVTTDLIERSSGPVVLTAVGNGAASSAGEISEALGDKVDLVLDAGPTRFSKPSTLLRVKEDGYEIVRAGVYDERIIEKLLRTTLLFVCSGNTCRSPMAEAIARAAIAKKLNLPPDQLDVRGINVLSAGAMAFPGGRATPQAAEAVAAFGGDLSRHRSRPLTVDLINQADRIFTMSRSHLSAVISLSPQARDKVAPLDPDGDIDDPIGGDLSLYQDVARRIHDLIEKRVIDSLKL